MEYSIYGISVEQIFAKTVTRLVYRSLLEIILDSYVYVNQNMWENIHSLTNIYPSAAFIMSDI